VCSVRAAAYSVEDFERFEAGLTRLEGALRGGGGGGGDEAQSRRRQAVAVAHGGAMWLDYAVATLQSSVAATAATAGRQQQPRQPQQGESSVAPPPRSMLLQLLEDTDRRSSGRQCERMLRRCVGVMDAAAVSQNG
jgi:hypothetical protein